LLERRLRLMRIEVWSERRRAPAPRTDGIVRDSRQGRSVTHRLSREKVSFPAEIPEKRQKLLGLVMAADQFRAMLQRADKVFCHPGWTPVPRL
jgi:hypothetical protein